MKQQRATRTKITYNKARAQSSWPEIVKTIIITIMVMSPALSLLVVVPVDALASPQQIRLSRGTRHTCFSPWPAGRCSTTCTLATTNLETTASSMITTEEIVERRVQKTITKRDVVSQQQKRRSLSEETRPEINGSQAWELRLYNDEDNFEFWVAEQLVKIVGLSEREAFDTMKLAGISGQATIGSYDCFELAEYYHTALQAEGLAVQLLPIQSC